jgi:DUF1680 family protein
MPLSGARQSGAREHQHRQPHGHGRRSLQNHHHPPDPISLLHSPHADCALDCHDDRHGCDSVTRARLSDHGGAAHLCPSHGSVLGAATRDQPHRHDSAHHAAERADRPRRQFPQGSAAEDGPYQGQGYNDTDVYKIIEAASWSLAATRDRALDAQLDELVAIVAAAQESDGYLYTPRTVDPANPAPGAGPERWSWLHTSHELYDQGHLIEAGIAHFQATGKRTLLNVAIKSADLICRVFGPSARRDAPGHEEIELALVKLYRVTGARKYLDTASFFLDERGRTHSVDHPQFEPGSRFSMYNDLAYRQDHAPVQTQRTAVGHAVRATYLYSAMTDIATILETGLATTVRALFGDVTSKKIYLTGGLGSEGRPEALRKSLHRQ